MNKNYYPTPNELIEKMLKDIDFNYIKTILEPSAGKGNIIEAIEKRTTKRSYYKIDVDIDCIELDEDLQATLKGKNNRLVHNNFLTYNTFKSYDLIIMNPPFDNGCKHLLKALEMQKKGGSIVCLLNAETLKNAYSNERKDLLNKLESVNANIEYIQNSFLNAERKTKVEVALIKIHIPKIANINLDILDKFKKPQQLLGEEKTFQENMITKYSRENDFVNLIVEQCKTETRMGLHLIDEYGKMKPYLLKNAYADKEKKYSEYEYSLSLTIASEENKDYRYSQYECTPNKFVKVMRKKYWNALFHNKKITGKLTQNLKEELESKIDEYANYDFSIFNVYTLMQEVNKSTIKGIEDTIMNLFDEMSGKYAYGKELNNKNIHYFNGWKTNKAWYIGNKVILPNLRSTWQGRDKLEDIHKTLSYLDGNISDLDVEEEIKIQYKERECGSYSYWDTYVPDVDLPYFSVHFYKKGTAHIKFTNKELLDKFNLFACKNRNEIPHFYGKKAYKDMNTKEKGLVKEFSGSEKEYNKIYENQSKYLIDIEKQLLLR